MTAAESPPSRPSFLDRVETLGNRIPHAGTMFLALCVFIVLLSALCSFLGMSVAAPRGEGSIEARNLISAAGLQHILENTITNFTGFAPIGTVLVAILGFGIAERSGLLGISLRTLILGAPRRLLTSILVLSGLLSSLAVDAGYVILIPLGGILFAAVGRHPLGGIAATFAGVSGGYSANLLIGPVDVILAGISTEATQLVASDYQVAITANYYFMLASVVLLTLAGTWVTERIVMPRLPVYSQEETASTLQNSPRERSGLIRTGWFTLAYGGAVAAIAVTTPALRGSLLTGIVILLSAYAAIAGVIFGRAAGVWRKPNAIMGSMGDTMSGMGDYLVIMFFAAQFIDYFSWTQLGPILAISSAHQLQALALPPEFLMAGFVLIVAALNLVMGSASAKWALIGPIFVPIFFLLGISPEAAQMAYRIGDSSTNIITPLMPYFPLVVVYVQRYKKDAGIGTVAALMLPYSLVFLLGWCLLLVLWGMLNLPLGPGAAFVLPGS